MVLSGETVTPVNRGEPGMPGTASRDHWEPFCSAISRRSISDRGPQVLPHVYPATTACRSGPMLTLVSPPGTGLNAPTITGTGLGERDTRTATTTPAKVR